MLCVNVVKFGDVMFRGKLNTLRYRFIKAVCGGFLLTACAATTTSSNVPQWLNNSSPPGINFVDIAPSSNGKAIAFEYIDRSITGQSGVPNRLGVGVLDLQSGKLTRIPEPAGQQLSSPSFSHDNKKLLVSVGDANGLISRQIAEVDLASLQLTMLTAKEFQRQEYPVYQPGSNRVLYAYGSPAGYVGLMLLNPATSEKQVIIEPDRGFHTIGKPSFVGMRDIIFRASGAAPQNPLYSRTLNLELFPSYKLRFGEHVKFLSIEAEQQELARKFPGNDGAYGQLSASLDGRIMAFISQPSDRLYNERGYVLRELFKNEQGQATRLTHHYQQMSDASISYDGSTVAYVADIDATQKFDLLLYDMRTGRVAATGLLDRIRTDPTFVLK